MHSNTKRLRAASFVVAAALLAAACGDNAESASLFGNDQTGDDDGFGSGVILPAADDPVEGDDFGPIEPEPHLTEGQPDLGRPDEVVPAIRKRLDDADDTGRNLDGEILEAVGPLDHGPDPDQAVGLRDGRSRNEAGELNRLDEAAALACGDVERALTALDDGDGRQAADLLASAADRAALSSVTDIEVWSTTLAESVNTGTNTDGALVPLLGFLSVCTRGGYEL